MQFVWVICSNCDYEEKEFSVPTLPMPKTPCPKCGEPLGRTYKDLYFSIKTADLTTFQDSWQPSLGKVIHSKRQMTQELLMLKEKTGKTWEWDPTLPKVVKEADQIRKEPGGEKYLVDRLKTEATEKASKRFEEGLDKDLRVLANGGIGQTA